MKNSKIFRKNLAKLAKNKLPLSQLVSKIDKKVTKMENMATVRPARCYYGISSSQDVGSLTLDYNYLSLTRFSDFQSIFGTDATDGQGRNATIHSFTIDNYITLQNPNTTLPGPETAPTQFTYFIVSLKNEATSLLGSNGLLNTLSNNTHYYKNGGLVMLNKRYFNIHYYKKFVLSNNFVSLGTSSAQTQYGIDRRFKAKVKCNRKVTNPAGDWKAMNFSPDVRDNYFALCFSDSSLVDGEAPKWIYNEIIAMDVTA